MNYPDEIQIEDEESGGARKHKFMEKRLHQEWSNDNRVMTEEADNQQLLYRDEFTRRYYPNAQL